MSFIHGYHDNLLVINGVSSAIGYKNAVGVIHQVACL